MAKSIEMASIDDQILRIPLIEKDEIEEGSKVDHSININQIFAKKFKDLDNSPIKSRTIFKVNVLLRELNPDAYAPKMVSIGPYHKKNPRLHPMEKYKLLYLMRFLGRKKGLDVESCIKELEGLKEKALKCYDDVETDEFCQILLLDGCFVVEFIRECNNKCQTGDRIISKFNNVHIFRDLMLLENQLPFFILNKLHDMTKRDNEPPLATLLENEFNLNPFFVKLTEITSISFLEITRGNIKHLLDLEHAVSCQSNHMKELKVAGGCSNVVMQNATELSEAGVSFAEASFKTTIFDSIEFENGLMKIPQLRVTYATETLLRNLIAYEQQSDAVQPKHFSNFAVFMDNLIESDKDVNLLRQKGIIENCLGDDKEVAKLFNKIGNGVVLTDHNFYYEEVCKEVVKYCKKPRNKMRALYLKNGLRQASTLIAFIGLIYTCIQTFLAFTGPLFNIEKIIIKV